MSPAVICFLKCKKINEIQFYKDINSLPRLGGVYTNFSLTAPRDNTLDIFILIGSLCADSSWVRVPEMICLLLR